jgi:hypothetical protein
VIRRKALGLLPLLAVASLNPAANPNPMSHVTLFERRRNQHDVSGMSKGRKRRQREINKAQDKQIEVGNRPEVLRVRCLSGWKCVPSL